jgi:hypothetical protein
MAVNEPDNPEEGESGMNSVVFEGTVQNEPVVTGEGEGRRCSFVLSAWRNHYLENGDCVQRKEGASVRVVARKSELVEEAVKHAYAGRKVCVVGRIADDGGLHIEADHIVCHWEAPW